ncbi:MAG: 16S rRNA (guanine(527)-N(7))-methyltransferase RsmG [Acidobacteriota bacterium]|nr:16S rRNA (guanine(527)-N(7))-methyltransferase RsmG [Acidobacteriota bacterium]
METIDWIRQATERAGIPLAADAMDRFEKYRALLLEWNQKINLISRSDEERIVSRHFLGSIGLLSCIRMQDGTRVLDLGSGAGFPGLPLKIMRPDLDMVLVEATRKKTVFLGNVIQSLGLSGITVVADRIENSAGDIRRVSWVVSRAVSDMSTLFRWSRPVLSNGGILAVIKGGTAEKETNELIRRKTVRPSACSRIPYNPFPEHAPLEGSELVLVRKESSRPPANH